MVLDESPEDTIRDSKIKAAVGRFIDSKDIPSWYRAYSKFQIKAADELMAAIRDDVEQETTHRVQHCLSVLGLVPLLDNKNLQMLMKLSGGNDLAFLWFLMELHYKTPGDKEYSLNEQLILSGIAHLDMVTTLRGLDRVLPPGHLSKRTLSKYRARLRKPKKASSMYIAHKEKYKKLQPYFEKLERPKELEKTFLISERPDFKVKFRTYEKYKDANYQPPNESNRWFTLYQLKDSLRVSVVELRSLFDDFFKTLTLQRPRVSTAIQIIDKALEKLDNDPDDDTPIERSLCLMHRKQKDLLDRKRQEREVAEREKCFQKLEIFCKEKEQRIARIREILRKEVDMYRNKYSEELKKDNRKEFVHVLDKETYSEHSFQAKDRCENEPECIKSDKTEKLAIVGETQVKEDRPSQASRTTSRRSTKEGKEKSEKMPKSNTKRARGGSISFLRPSASGFTTTNMDSRSSLPKKIHTPASQLFFKSATEHQPYKFNYENIFNDEYYDEDSEKFIKNVVVAALNTKKQYESEENLVKILRPMPNVSKAATKYANEKWNKELETQRIIIHDTRKAIGLESAEDLVAQQHMPERSLAPDMPILEFYDCEDKVLMHRMLEIGLNHLAKNHKYVLASIPDAHKLPDLREWIYQRYGKTYTQAERVNDYLLSQRLLAGLINLKVNVKMPTTRDVGRNNIQTYACAKYLRNKVERIRNAYFNRVSLANMEFARLVWFSMNNSLCSISQRGMYFAYMPQRIKDINLINPWKLHHVKNMKSMWEQKKLRLAREARTKF